MPKYQFDCSCGSFVIEIIEDWAPQGVARFLELVERRFFDGVRFFRVVTKPRPFIVQFGINGEPETAAQWRHNTIPDDPVKQSNAAGTLTYATAGPGTRTTQLFINLADNRFLDDQGFAPIGRVTEGMETVRAICDQYGERPDQGNIQRKGNAYLEEHLPNLDYIKEVTVLA